MPVPDPDDPRYNKIWRTLDRALAMPCFTSVEHSVIQSARELSHTSSVLEGSRKARSFQLHSAALADAWGLNRESIYRAVNVLLADKVFLGDRANLRLNTKYRTWAEKHALTEKQAAYCDLAAVRPVTSCGSYHMNAQEGECIQKVSKVRPKSLNETKKSHPGETKKSQECIQKVSTHIAERPRKRESERDSLLVNSTPPQEQDAGGGGGGPEAGKELDKLQDHVARLTGDDNLALVFRDQVTDWFNSGMLVDDVRQAIITADANGVSGSGYLSYVASVSRRVRADRARRESAEANAPPGSIPTAGSSFAPRLTKGERTAQANAARKAGLMRMFPPTTEGGKDHG